MLTYYGLGALPTATGAARVGSRSNQLIQGVDYTQRFNARGQTEIVGRSAYGKAMIGAFIKGMKSAITGAQIYVDLANPVYGPTTHDLVRKMFMGTSPYSKLRSLNPDQSWFRSGAGGMLGTVSEKAFIDELDIWYPRFKQAYSVFPIMPQRAFTVTSYKAPLVPTTAPRTTTTTSKEGGTALAPIPGLPAPLAPIPTAPKVDMGTGKETAVMVPIPPVAPAAAAPVMLPPASMGPAMDQGVEILQDMAEEGQMPVLTEDLAPKNPNLLPLALALGAAFLL